MALGQKEIGNRVRVYSSGLANSASELMLYAIHFNLDLGAGGEHVLDQEARAALTEIDMSSFKRALTHLKTKGFIEESNGTTTGFALTEEGLAEAKKVIPSYRESRDWDGSVYLINYDLPVTKNSIRNAFRDFLKSIGCGMLQHSLWLNPYDPRSALMKYINNNQLTRELVIVSRLNLDAEMYPYQIPGLVETAFGLSKLNSQYRNFLAVSAEGLSREKTIFEFLKILKEDPQVPYDLIPQDWAGYKAFELYKEII